MNLSIQGSFYKADQNKFRFYFSNQANTTSDTIKHLYAGLQSFKYLNHQTFEDSFKHYSTEIELMYCLLTKKIIFNAIHNCKHCYYEIG